MSERLSMYEALRRVRADQAAVDGELYEAKPPTSLDRARTRRLANQAREAAGLPPRPPLDDGPPEAA